MMSESRGGGVVPDPSDESGEDAQFVIKLPTFAVARRVLVHRVTGEIRCEGVVMFNCHDDATVSGVVVFTDRDAAAQYRDEQFPGYKLVPLNNQPELQQFLRIAAERAVGWVAFDPFRPDRKVTLLRLDLVLSWFESRN